MRVSERLTVGFGDPQARVLGVAIAGAGALLATGERVSASEAVRIGAQDGGWTAGAEGFEVALEAIGPPAQLGAGAAVALAATHAATAAGHGEEQLDAVILRGDPLERCAVEDPRLSTTYDADGRLARSGIELWESADAEFPERIGGEAVAHAELAGPDGAHTQVALVGWHRDGRRGGGYYAITTR